MSNPTDTTTGLYEIRQLPANTLPHERGTLVAVFETWAEVAEAAQEMVRAGMNIFIASPNE
jgi:hypothetical protein